MRRSLCIFSIVVAILSLSITVSFADNNSKTERSTVLELLPSESGSVTIPLLDEVDRSEEKQDPGLVAWFVVEATNQASSTVPTSHALAACSVSVTAHGYLGNALWTWSTTQHYSYNGTTVSLTGYNSTPSIHYPGWAHTSSSYSSSGSGSAVANSTSSGRFTYLIIVQAASGVNNFSINKNGVCTVSSTIIP
jgi:hypothetical protein